MKELTTDPENVFFSHWPWLDRKLVGLESALLDDKLDEVPNVYLIPHKDLQGKYLIYNGNHRLKFALVFNLPLRGYLIENDEDLSNIPFEDLADWGDDFKTVSDSIHERSQFVLEKYAQSYSKEIDWETERADLLRPYLP